MAAPDTMWSGLFWLAAGERAIKTAAQTAIATIGTTAAIHQVDWIIVGSTSALAALLSILTSVVSDGLTGSGPSLTSETVTAKRAIED